MAIDQEKFKRLMQAISTYIQSSDFYEKRARLFDAALKDAHANNPVAANVFDGSLEMVRRNPDLLQPLDEEFGEHVTASGRIVSHPRLGGLHHRYDRAA